MIITDVVNSFHTEIGNARARVIQLLVVINNTIRHKPIIVILILIYIVIYNKVISRSVLDLKFNY